MVKLDTKNKAVPKKRILVVEDEKAYSRSLSLKLTHEGYDVETAADGEEGLQKISKSAFDLILLDLVMPKLNGFGFLEAIRNQGNVTPVIVLSNLVQEEDKKKAQQYSVVDFFEKSTITLLEVVERVKKVFA